MTHKPTLTLRQPLDLHSRDVGRHMIGNISAAGLKVLESKHGCGDGVERRSDTVGVVSHDWYSAVCPDAVESARFFSSLSPE
ncbi:hypothetical protein [Kiloniella litopenaei]|uniref:hypothetical protein n=1 Tax=Kiloniella litopenaei TaxID=1549748 RepID=UPI0012FF191F|nr:hypothetical protein [Kiloniella litopenaei]